jgi:hypothetical protein
MNAFAVSQSNVLAGSTTVTNRIFVGDIIPTTQGSLGQVLVHKGMNTPSEWESLPPPGPFGERVLAFRPDSAVATLQTTDGDFAFGPTGTTFLTPVFNPAGQGPKLLTATMQFAHIDNAACTVSLSIRRSATGNPMLPAADFSFDFRQGGGGGGGGGGNQHKTVSVTYMDPSPVLGSNYALRMRCSQANNVQLVQAVLIYS